MKISSQIFPIGFILEVDSYNFNPNSKYDGTWQRIKGKVIVGVDENDSDFNVNGKIGGSKELQEHEHTKYLRWAKAEYAYGYTDTIHYSGVPTGGGVIVSSGKSGTGNSGNLQPYYCVYIWKLVSY